MASMAWGALAAAGTKSLRARMTPPPVGKHRSVPCSFSNANRLLLQFICDNKGSLWAESTAPLERTPEDSMNITKEQVDLAQKAWGEGIVRIASAHAKGEDYEKVARKHIDQLYAYGSSAVLFKPTLAKDEQFRPTYDQALSYFVATNGSCPEDKGFAIKGWTAVRFENGEVLSNGSMAMAMGNYFFTAPDGNEQKVEYSFGYIADKQGNLRIALHHSSMPYAG